MKLPKLHKKIKVPGMIAELSKPMKIMLLVVGILFGLIFTYKGIMMVMRNMYFAANKNPVVTVSTAVSGYQDWQPKLKAVGSLRAISGVNVTTELAGLVTKIYFTPGSYVEGGTVLIQLDADTEIGQLQSLRAQAALAKITYDRDKKQFSVNAISKQQLDNDLYTWQNLEGQAAAQAATVSKKTIRAPFAGQLGIRVVNLGQYLNTGDNVTTLQSLDPIYANFYLPQQALAQLKIGQTVHITTDTYPDKVFIGKITTIQPLVDTSTRNVEIEATIDNPEHTLTPGMYITAEVLSGESQKLLTLPVTAVSFNPYGDIVYIVEDGGKDKKGKSQLSVKQSFVTVGDSRGDQVTITGGLKAGQTVVTSGQLKLKNGSLIKVNNTVQPDSSANPVVTNDHQGS